MKFLPILAGPAVPALPYQVTRNRLPFGGQTHGLRRHCPARPCVPIARISEVPFLAVQIRMHPCTVTIAFILLRRGMRGVPITAAIVPEREKWEAEIRRRQPIASD